MKGNEALQKSYIKQKEVFEEARNRRIKNRLRQIEEINQKIQTLTNQKLRLIQQNNGEKGFIDFESFRSQAEEQSRTQKK